MVSASEARAAGPTLRTAAVPVPVLHRRNDAGILAARRRQTMTEIYKSLVVVSLIWTALVAGFVWIIRGRGFARFGRGFFAMVMVALAGMAMMAASIIGVWGYQASKDVVSRELVMELRNVADIVDAQLAASGERVGQRLDVLGRELAPMLRSGASAGQLAGLLREIQRFDSRYLQIGVVDKDLRPLATTSATADAEPVNRIGAAFTVEGKAFVSDPYESVVFKKQVVFIGAPIKDTGGEILGGVNLWFDLQTMLTDYLKTIRFNQSGYAVLATHNGRILAHPMAERVNDDISSYAAIQQAQRGRQHGSVVQRNKEGVRRLMLYRTIQNTATVDPKPWILLAEINESEVLAALQELYDEFAFGLGVLVVASLVIAWQLSVSIKQPVQELLTMVQQVKGGDLAATTAVAGRDELGQLGSALNEMAKGLQERDRVKDVFGRYIATQVSERSSRANGTLAARCAMSPSSSPTSTTSRPWPRNSRPSRAWRS